MNKFILTIILVLVPLVSIAETLYVSDTLRVGIRTSPNTNVPSIAVVKSGVAVDVLKRKGSYIKVRTKSGIEGWVKSAYFSKKPPTARKLTVALKEIDSLKKKIKSINKSKTASLSTTTADLNNKVSSLEKSNSALQNEIETLKSSSPTPTKTTGNILSISGITKEMIYIALGTLVILFGLGFVFGISWHKGQVAKRLGGMSI